MPASLDTTRTTLRSTTGTRSPKAKQATAWAVYIPTNGNLIKSSGRDGRPPAPVIDEARSMSALVLWFPNPKTAIMSKSSSALAAASSSASRYRLTRDGHTLATLPACVCLSNISATRIPNGLTFSSRQGNGRPCEVYNWTKKSSVISNPGGLRIGALFCLVMRLTVKSSRSRLCYVSEQPYPKASAIALATASASGGGTASEINRTCSVNVPSSWYECVKPWSNMAS